MAELFATVLRAYGQQVQVRRGTEEALQLALVQPVTGEREPQESGGPLGRVDRRCWRYLGQGPLKRGDRVVCPEGTFTVETAAELRVGQTVSHWEAALRREREVAG